MVTRTGGRLPAASASTTSSGTANPVAVLPPSSIVVAKRMRGGSGESGVEVGQVADELRICARSERRGERAAHAGRGVEQTEHDHLVTGVARPLEPIEALDDRLVD